MIYYAAPKKKPELESLDEVDPELLKMYDKLGISLEEQKKLSGVAVDVVLDSVSVKTTFTAKLKLVAPPTVPGHEKPIRGGWEVSTLGSLHDRAFCSRACSRSRSSRSSRCSRVAAQSVTLRELWVPESLTTAALVPRTRRARSVVVGWTRTPATS